MRLIQSPERLRVIREHYLLIDDEGEINPAVHDELCGLARLGLFLLEHADAMRIIADVLNDAVVILDGAPDADSSDKTLARKMPG